jgi:kynurenine formamidase
LTGWSERFGNPIAYRNADATGTMRYPAYGEEAAEYLIKSRQVAALGLDTISADYGLSTDYPVHKLALGQGVLLIENLNNLDKLPARGALTFFGAIRVKDGTGSPARVIAIVP